MKLSIVCPVELSTFVGQYCCIRMELYVLVKMEVIIAYLSAVNTPPMTEQQTKDTLKILAE